MSLNKTLSVISLAAMSLFGLSACWGNDVGASNGDVGVSGTDSRDVTCDRFNEINGRFHNMDLDSMDTEEVASQLGEGIADIEVVSNDAENMELADSIQVMAEALRTSVASAEGDLDSIHAQFQEQLQRVEVQEAAAYIDETCNANMNL